MTETKHLAKDFRFETPALRLIGLEVARRGGVNLAQGLCMLPVPEEVIEGASRALRGGHNRYSLAQGAVELREVLAGRLRTFNSIDASVDSLVITAGSTGAFEVVCEAFLNPGDEVVNFVPFYPYHRNTLLRRGAVVRYVRLNKPNWDFSVAELRQAITPRTKFILVTNPGNPTGKVFSQDELLSIGEIAREAGILVVTDEVYEYLTYDGRSHTSIASLPQMADTVITMGSYSKTFAITGWRIGYLNVPEPWYELLKTINDQMFVCPPTPLQHGVAHGIRNLSPEFYSRQREKYQYKRESLCGGLAAAGLAPSVPQGAYYVIADTSARFPGIPSEEVANLLLERAGVAGVPASDFLGPEVKGDGFLSNFIRFSYSVEDDLIERAVRGLQGL